ncbi:MAG: trypsin-like peptidase domain-containing protein [Spirochaetales bacterium]|nr:trypsin-like peptidase domain-containing protein [Spirochaetales bacterium]MCF7938003.1 trypsin-like peptidase domain-containing protein [Spirochaetales bacterium]
MKGWHTQHCSCRTGIQRKGLGLFSLFSLVLLSFVIFGSCAGGPGVKEEQTETFPSIDQVTREQIESLIDTGKTERALQMLSRLQREENIMSKTVIRELDRRARRRLERDYQQALNQDPKAAARLFHSLSSATEASQNPDGSLGSEEAVSGLELTLEVADSYLEEGNKVLAVHTFLETLKNIEQKNSEEAGNASRLENLLENRIGKYLDTAMELGHNSAVARIVRAMDVLSLSVSEKARKTAEKVPFNPQAMVKGVVTIWVDKGIRIEQGVGLPDRVIGSGFFIDPRGYIITNHHVIKSEVDPEYEGYSRLFVRLYDRPEERIPAKVVSYDEVFDIALLKVEKTPQYTFSFPEPVEPEIGEQIFAIGSPVGLENTITSGIVSAVNRRFLQLGDALQVDVPVNPGNSGGPVINQDGRLVGIVFAGLETFEGLNFIIPSHWVRGILPELYSGGEVVHPWLGAALRDGSNSVEVTYTLPTSPAKEGGLKKGDQLISLNGKPIEDISAAQKIVLSYDPKTLVRLKWKRNGTVMEGLFSLGERPLKPVQKALDLDVKNNLFPPLFGMEVEEVRSLLFGATDYRVTRVYPGSAADETGISTNDSITVRNWKVDRNNRFVAIEVVVKKRKGGFMESVIRLAAPLESNKFF